MLFFVWDGNHRFLAWYNYINRIHPTRKEKHIRVDSIILDPKNDIAQLLTAMHDVNKGTETSHVTRNLVHTLFRMQSIGVLPLESFRKVVTPEVYDRSEKRKVETWYALARDAFLNYMYSQELSEVGERAKEVYYAAKPEDERTARGVAAVIRDEIETHRRHLHSAFIKQLTIADPALTPEFLNQVRIHWSKNPKPEMTQEKLYRLCTSMVDAEQKVEWLKIWNGSPVYRGATGFPSAPFSDFTFETWLHKATFWSQLERKAAQTLAETFCEFRITNNTIPGSLETFQVYMQRWKSTCWKAAFFREFAIKDGIKRSFEFQDQYNGDAAMRRTVFRYIHFVLDPAKTLSHLPPYITSWRDISSDQCMYTSGIIKDWGTEHLQECGWYLDCPCNDTPFEELHLKQRLSVQALDTTIDQDDIEKSIRAATAREIPRPSPAKMKKRKGKQGEASPAKPPESTAAVIFRSPSPPLRATRRGKSLEHPYDVHVHPGLVLSSTQSKIVLQSFIDMMMMKKEADKKHETCSPWQNLTTFLTLVSQGQQSWINGVRSAFAADLVLVTIPDGLPVLGIEGSTVVPRWNTFNEGFWPWAFGICKKILSDSGALLILQSKDTRSRHQLARWLPASGFRVHKNWICINTLPLSKGDFSGQKTLAFDAICLSKVQGAETENLHRPFSLSSKGQLIDPFSDPLKLDILYNNVETKKLMKNPIGEPWRGGTEKSPAFMQSLIETCSGARARVVDLTAGAGASVHACRSSGKHLYAMEADEGLYNLVLAPLDVGSSTATQTDTNTGGDPGSPLPEANLDDYSCKDDASSRLHGFDLQPSGRPNESFVLPSYAAKAAAIMASSLSPPTQLIGLSRRKYHRSVLKYIEVEAKECSGSDSSVSL